MTGGPIKQQTSSLDEITDEEREREAEKLEELLRKLDELVPYDVGCDLSALSIPCTLYLYCVSFNLISMIHTLCVFAQTLDVMAQFLRPPPLIVDTVHGVYLEIFM